MEVIAPHRLLILLVMLLYLACASYPRTAETSNKMMPKFLLDMSSSGQKIKIKVGDEIQIELKAIGSTGYAWYFDKLDEGLFELMGEERKIEPPEKGDMVGTPAVMVWKLKAKKAGTGVIRMLYYRQWEGKDKAVNQFEILVDVTA